MWRFEIFFVIELLVKWNKLNTYLRLWETIMIFHYISDIDKTINIRHFNCLFKFVNPQNVYIYMFTYKKYWQLKMTKRGIQTTQVQIDGFNVSS